MPKRTEGKQENTCADLRFDFPRKTPFPVERAGYRVWLRHLWRDQFGFRCPECTTPMTFDGKRSRRHNFATIDHILARSLGGTDLLENLRVICWLCNQKKSIIERGSFSSPLIADEKEPWPWHDNLRAYNRSMGCTMDSFIDAPLKERL